jgi:3D (Asp-Asp-Asp) domain-containing protein
MEHLKQAAIVLVLCLTIWLGWKFVNKPRPIIVDNTKHECVIDTLTVNATIYNAESDQTDASPYLTASGFCINKDNPGKHRIVAISQDLLKRFKYGDSIYVTGVGDLSGKYYIQDCMNKRFKNTIDLLVNTNTKCWGVWKKIIIFKY